VLSTPPAFVLSQNQTLQTKTPTPKTAQAEFESEQVRPNNQSQTGIKKNHTPKREKEAWQKTTTNKNHQTHY
jgi:hypothetical protein